MSEDQRFEPTRSRLQRALREGDVPRSTDLVGSCAFAAALAATLAVAPLIAGAARAALVAAAGLRPGASVPLCAMGAYMLLPGAAGALGGFTGAALQGGIRLRTLEFKPARLSVVAGLKRMFSRETVMGVTRASAAILCAGCTFAPLARKLADLTSAQNAAAIGGIAWHSALACGAVAAGIGVLFGTADFALVFARWKQRLRMTFAELRRDHKENDGDPGTKGRRRNLHRELSKASLQRLKDAAFVIVNPTHVAVALEYAPPAIPVPRVLLCAADDGALRIREAAEDLQIPVVRHVTLARTLFAHARAGDVIPKNTYVAVAEIVAALVKSGALL